MISPCISALGVFPPSPILSLDPSYESRLSEFLSPVVRPDTHWVLCYRASIHGWAASTFHFRCDFKPETVTIIKVGQYVFGGYSDLAWGIMHLMFYT